MLPNICSDLLCLDMGKLWEKVWFYTSVFQWHVISSEQTNEYWPQETHLNGTTYVVTNLQWSYNSTSWASLHYSRRVPAGTCIHYLQCQIFLPCVLFILNPLGHFQSSFLKHPYWTRCMSHFHFKSTAYHYHLESVHMQTSKWLQWIPLPQDS